ncbi:glycosyltransferase family 2 protein [Sinorhizobium sp. Sb3]|uniref:glycosyltransferase family 2 protein n=1 Tax=Sinorhizobium sp. Sb3 TaxID=1358417 RepID=UPI0007C64B24|nr:glycosyltransferase family 2 protein [Sinorhizobium sp. Sb3]
MSSIAVVICAYCDERRLQLGDAINSVLKQARKPDRLVVVIDHNDDLLREMRTSYPGVEVIANDGARGLSGARNTGVRAAAPCDIVAFLDDDAVAEADWLQRLALHFVDPNIIASVARCCHFGQISDRAGFQKNSSGWSAAVTRACRTG